MGIFLKITSDSYGGETVEKADINNKVLHYITDALNDYVWQDSIAPKLRKIDAKYSHITLGTILRFYLQRYIEVGNLKSFARYIMLLTLQIVQRLTVTVVQMLTENLTRTGSELVPSLPVAVRSRPRRYPSYIR